MDWAGYRNTAEGGGRRGKSGRTGTRTQDQLVKSQLLYQLSYPSTSDVGNSERRTGGQPGRRAM